MKDCYWSPFSVGAGAEPQAALISVVSDQWQ
jgi:hypothetical protein